MRRRSESRGRAGRQGSFGDAFWWTSNVAISGNQVFDPETALGRLITVVLSMYAVVVFASVAATFGAFFIESVPRELTWRTTRATERVCFLDPSGHYLEALTARYDGTALG